MFSSASDPKLWPTRPVPRPSRPDPPTRPSQPASLKRPPFVLNPAPQAKPGKATGLGLTHSRLSIILMEFKQCVVLGVKTALSGCICHKSGLGLREFVFIFLIMLSIVSAGGHNPSLYMPFGDCSSLHAHFRPQGMCIYLRDVP